MAQADRLERMADRSPLRFGARLVDKTHYAAALRRRTHQTIAAVTDDYEAFKYNTAIAKLMELTNTLVAADRDGVQGAPVREAIRGRPIPCSAVS